MSLNSFAAAVLALACSSLAGCGDLSSPGPAPPSAPTPIPTPAPVPTPAPALAPPPQYTATPVPFNLTRSRTFDIWGWDSWPSAPTPSGIGLRWDAAIGKYEVLAPRHADWSRLEAVQSRVDSWPVEYDVFANDGTKHSFRMILYASQSADGYVGNARIFEGPSAQAYFAFGMATEPGDVPVSGVISCIFAEDEIGEGQLTFDLANGTLSGWAEPFWENVRYPLVQTSFTPGATTFGASLGSFGVLEGRFFGPRSAGVAVRAKGGGTGFAAVTGVMTGECR
jgi:hypothetical protein